jgi:hypothetical protein
MDLQGASGLQHHIIHKKHPRGAAVEGLNLLIVQQIKQISRSMLIYAGSALLKMRRRDAFLRYARAGVQVRKSLCTA